MTIMNRDKKLLKDYRDWGIEILPEYLDEHFKVESLFRKIYGENHYNYLKALYLPKTRGKQS
jgi:hypothetical protein